MSIPKDQWFKKNLVNKTVDELSWYGSNRSTQNVFIRKINTYLSEIGENITKEITDGIEKSIVILDIRKLKIEQIRPLVSFLKKVETLNSYHALSRLLLDAMRYTNDETLIQELKEACAQYHRPPSEKEAPYNVIDEPITTKSTRLDKHITATPLQAAVIDGDLKQVEWLLEHGAQINNQGTDGNTPLLSALNFGHEEIALFLIEKGAHVNVVGSHEMTPLLLALKFGHREIVLLLINKGADVNATASNELTPPQIAASREDEELMSLLIDKKVNVNAANSKEGTSLHIACKNKNKKLIELLISSGAFVFARDSAGYLPFDYLSKEILDSLPQNYREVYEQARLIWKYQGIDLAKNCSQFRITNEEPMKEIWGLYYANAMEEYHLRENTELIQSLSNSADLRWGFPLSLKAWIDKAIALEIPTDFESKEEEIKCQKAIDTLRAELIEEGVKANIRQEFFETWERAVIKKTHSPHQQMKLMVWMSDFIMRCSSYPPLLSILQNPIAEATLLRISKIANSDMQVMAANALFEIYKSEEKKEAWESLAKTQPPHLLLTSLLLVLEGIPKDTIEKILESLTAKKYQNTEKMQPIHEMINTLTKKSGLSIQDQTRLLEIVFINPAKGKTESQKIYKKRFEKHREDQDLLLVFIPIMITFDSSHLLRDVSDAETIKSRSIDIIGKPFNIKDPIMLEKMIAIFYYSKRYPAALFIYAQKLQSLPDEEKRLVNPLLQQFAIAVLDGSFPEIRYSFEDNPHLETIFKEDSSLLDQWRTPVKIPLGEGFTMEDSDQWEDLLLSGTEMQGSCQDIKDVAHINKCLIAYILDGKNRLMLIRDKNQKIVLRVFLRILWDPVKKTPVLFMERSYSNPTHLIPAKKLEEGCIAKAHAMGLPLLANIGNYPHLKTHPKYPGSVEALGSQAPFEYVDAKEKGTTSIKENGKFSIPSSHIVYDPNSKS